MPCSSFSATSASRQYALIVASGKGTRMGGTCPKPFLPLAGKPLLLHTVEAFFRYSPHIKVIVALAREYVSLWEKARDDHHFYRPVSVCYGGATRSLSVQNGLAHIGDRGWVAIHDGVRPLVSRRLIASSFEMATAHRAAVPAVPLKDSLRRLQPDGSDAVDRSLYRLAQTPQTFEVNLIKKAYLQVADEVADEATVVERAGYAVRLFEGEYRNIKVTTPEDISIAEALLHGERNT